MFYCNFHDFSILNLLFHLNQTKIINILIPIFVLGHYGSGKTMLGAEAVKIISAGLENPVVLVLTWDADGYFNYKLLNQDLEEKWFHGQKNIQIQHMTDFIKNFVQEHGHDFSPK